MEKVRELYCFIITKRKKLVRFNEKCKYFVLPLVRFFTNENKSPRLMYPSTQFIQNLVRLEILHINLRQTIIWRQLVVFQITSLVLGKISVLPWAKILYISAIPKLEFHSKIVYQIFAKRFARIEWFFISTVHLLNCKINK